jgi:hypothetical protein
VKFNNNQKKNTILRPKDKAPEFKIDLVDNTQ